MTFRECLTLFPLVALTILFGVYPKPVLDMSAASVAQLVNNYSTAIGGREGRRADALRPCAMSFETAGYQLLPALPELVLAVGAMVLLMLGAYRGQGTTALVTALAVVLLVVTGVLELMLPAGKLVYVRRQLHRRRFRALPEDPGADRLGRDADPVARSSCPIRRGASSNMRSWCCSRRSA